MHYHAEVWVPEKTGYVERVRTTLADLEEEEDDREGFYDWYVIGGRWSGEHCLLKLKKQYGEQKLQDICTEFEKEYGWWCGKGINREQRAKEYKKVFRKYISKKEFSGIIPAWRDSYKEEGYDDDIISVSEVPWEYFSCYTFIVADTFSNSRLIFHDREGDDVEPFNAEEILKSLEIKDGYLVTVDYHN